MTRNDISALLFQLWDPLGVSAFAPTDEYDDYAALQEMVAATVDAIRTYFSEARVEPLPMAPNQ